MACPVCDHTMQHVNGTARVFWCPRCGTLKDCDMRAAAGLPDEVTEGDDLGIDQPKLIGRVFNLSERVTDLLADTNIWRNVSARDASPHREAIGHESLRVEDCITK